MNPARRLRFSLLLPTAMSFGTLAASARAQAHEQQELVPPSTGIAGFGRRSAVDGDVLVGGAPTDDTAGTSAGAAYVYRRDAATGEWLFEQALAASDPQNYAQFGLSVAVEGDVIVVAAPFHTKTGIGDNGMLYVFRRDAVAGTWVEEQKLEAAGGLSGDRLGLALDLSGDRIVAGTLYDDTSAGADAGSATIFRYQDPVLLWTEETTLLDPDGAPSDYAGWDVAIDGMTIAVASPRSPEGGFSNAGSVAIWTLSSGAWIQTQELQPSNVSNSKFGSSIALHGSQLLVGAPEEDHVSGLTLTGAAYLFDWDGATWSEQHRFLPPNPATDNQFGWDLDVRGDLAAIGEPYFEASVSFPDIGSAWLFRRRNPNHAWAVDQQLVRSAAESFDTVGSDVDLGDDVVALAAQSARTSSGSDSGAIDLYDAAEIALTITPGDPAPSAPIDVEVHRGDPGTLFLVVVEDVSGVFLFLPVIVTVFNADHAWSAAVTAPNPAFGLHVGLRAWKVSPTGRVVASDWAYVDV